MEKVTKESNTRPLRIQSKCLVVDYQEQDLASGVALW
jgi:hypothetical protein